MYAETVRFLSEYLIFTLFIPLPYFLYKKDINTLVKLCTSIVLVYLMRKIAGTLWYEPRPFVVDPQAAIYPFYHLPDSSFFSTHASVSMALASSVYFVHKKTGRVLIIGALLVALGRVLGGMHYFHDVLAGIIAGLAVSFLVNKYYNRVWKYLTELKKSLVDI